MSHTIKPWTEEELQYLREHAESMLIKDMAKHLGRSRASVHGAMGRYGICTGRTGCFPKGHKSWNTGMKGLIVSEKIKKTWFKKGHKPQNTLYDGALTIRHDHPRRGGNKYMWIRLKENVWYPYHKYLWERKYGPVPEQHVLMFKNGNTLDCRIENIRLITMAENLERNRNVKKSIEALKKYQKGNNHPAVNLTDGYVAFLLSGGDKEIKDFLMEKRTDLIEIARLNYKLNREIRQKSED